MLRHATACDNESTTGEVGDATPRDRKRKSESNLEQDAALSCDVVQERRAWDSNPQPVTRHLNSNQAASHSLTLRAETPTEIPGLLRYTS